MHLWKGSVQNGSYLQLRQHVGLSRGMVLLQTCCALLRSQRSKQSSKQFTTERLSFELALTSLTLSGPKTSRKKESGVMSRHAQSSRCIDSTSLMTVPLLKALLAYTTAAHFSTGLPSCASAQTLRTYSSQSVVSSGRLTLINPDLTNLRMLVFHASPFLGQPGYDGPISFVIGRLQL